MNKKELLEKLKDLPDDAYIHFCILVPTSKGWRWQLLNPSIPHEGDPADVIGLVTAPVWRERLADYSG